MFGTTLAIALGGIVASHHLHADLLNSVLHSPMSFFEITPSGNLLNRFSKEIDAIDCMIPEGLKMMLGYLFKLLEICIIVLLATPYTGLVLLPLACIYIFIQVKHVSEMLPHLVLNLLDHIFFSWSPEFLCSHILPAAAFGGGESITNLQPL